ncbi:MAG: hypothetical protein ACRDKI_06310 [Solirubrobacterales bacterium]
MDRTRTHLSVFTVTLVVLAAFAAPAQAARLHTTITGGPRGETNDPTPTFTFVANRRKAAFKCSVDRGSWASCSSPFTADFLNDGNHVFAVKAVRRGASERRSAVRRFTVNTTNGSADDGFDIDPPVVEPDDPAVDPVP